MSPSATVAPIHEISIPRAVHGIAPPSPLVKGHGPAATRALLNEVLLESSHLKGGSKTAEVLLALLLHVVLIGGPVVAGLYYTDTINLKQFATTFLFAPPPPPPLPAPAVGVVKPQLSRRVFMSEEGCSRLPTSRSRFDSSWKSQLNRMISLVCSEAFPVEYRAANWTGTTTESDREGKSAIPCARATNAC